MELSKQKTALIRAGYWLLAIGGAYLLVRYLVPFLLPFLIGLLIAWLLRPVASFISRHSRISRRSASVVAAVAFYLVLGVLLWLTGVWLADLLRYAAGELPRLYEESLLPFLSGLFERLGNLQRRFLSRMPRESEQVMEGVQQALGGLAGTASAWLMEAAGRFARGIPGTVLAVIFTILSSVLICADYDRVCAFVMGQIPAGMRKTLLEVRDFLAGTLWRLVRAYLILMAITFAFLLVGLWVLKVQGALAVAAVIAVLDLLPVLGSGAVLLPWSVYLLLGGELYQGAGLLVLWAVLSAARQVLEPKIVGDSIGLHPLVSLTAMYVGLRFAGFWGLLLAPVLCLLVQYLQRRGLIHLFKGA